MKKKPSLIFSILMNVLSNLETNDEYSINEISEKSGLHWQTTNEYIRILTHILKSSPKIKINDNNKIQIIKRSEFFENLSVGQRILVMLYESKSFDEKSAMRIKNVISDPELEVTLEKLSAKEQIRKVSPEDKFFITKQGKIVVIGLYSDNSSQIFSFDENSGEDFLNEVSSEAIEKLNLKYNKLVNQNNEILMQNRLIMLFLANLGQNVESSQEKFVSEDITSGKAFTGLNQYFQKIFSLKKTYQNEREININIKTTDEGSLNYQYSDLEVFYKTFLLHSKKQENEKSIEVIR